MFPVINTQQPVKAFQQTYSIWKSVEEPTFININSVKELVKILMDD